MRMVVDKNWWSCMEGAGVEAMLWSVMVQQQIIVCLSMCTQTKFTTQNILNSVCPVTYNTAWTIQYREWMSEWVSEQGETKHRSRWIDTKTKKLISNKEKYRGERVGGKRERFKIFTTRISQVFYLKQCIHLSGWSLGGGWTALSSDTWSSSAHTRISLPVRQNQVMLDCQTQR